MSDEPATPRGPPVAVTVRRYKTAEITVTISAGLLVDEVARRKEISRDALLKLLIGDGLAKWEGA